MPCSRIDAPLAQCAPRLIGESKTGSCRTHTPFCTTASTEQPTEQCVHTVRLTSTVPPVWVSAARAFPIIENGSWLNAAPAPTPIPERLRNVRRSIVLPRNAAALRLSRLALLVAVLAFLVSSMAASGLRFSPYGSNCGCDL